MTIYEYPLPEDFKIYKLYLFSKYLLVVDNPANIIYLRCLFKLV